jgi:hypothetical protein
VSVLVRARQLRWLVALAFALVASHVHAQSATPRVALVAAGPELEAAARAALEPWGVVIAVVPGPSPGATAPDSNEAARALATAHEANALVWVSEHQGGYALWVYDLATHHVIERTLADGPPFDGATAAAVALSVKTLLRHSAAAPPAERYGASSRAPARAPAPAPARAPASARTPAPGQRASSAAGVARTAVPAERDDDADHEQEPLSANELAALRPSLLELALSGGVRLAATRPGTVEPRFGLALSWWPSGGPLGVETGASAGPAIAVRDAYFDGQLFDAAGHVAFALRRAFARQVRAQAGVEGGLHVLVLDGALARDGQDSGATRVTPSLALRVRGEWALDARLRLGLFAALAYVLRAERYLVEEHEVFAVTHVGVETGVTVAVAVLE